MFIAVALLYIRDSLITQNLRTVNFHSPLKEGEADLGNRNVMFICNVAINEYTIFRIVTRLL